MAILVLFKQFLGKFCLRFWLLILRNRATDRRKVTARQLAAMQTDREANSRHYDN